MVFEALYFQKPVCVLRDSNTGMYVPEGVGIPFVDSDSLLKLLNKLPEDMGTATVEKNEYWSTDGVANNFRHFWKTHIIK